MKEDTDKNRWGFVKPTITPGGDIFFCSFDLPQDELTAREQKVGLRRYAHFVNKDDSYFGKPKQSPGQILYQKLETFFEKQVRTFFEEHKIARWEPEDYSDEGHFEKVLICTNNPLSLLGLSILKSISPPDLSVVGFNLTTFLSIFP